MKLTFIFSILLTTVFSDHSDHVLTLLNRQQNADQIDAVKDVIARVLPHWADQIDVEITHDVIAITGVEWGGAVVDTHNKRLRIRGWFAVDVLLGVQRYLRDCCGAHFSWDGNQVGTLPKKLPLPRKRVVYASVKLIRYISNTCTFSYSYVWWDWARWEKYIDWMALQGFNIPLMTVGEEAVMTRVWRRIGLTDDQIAQHFTGPPFLAWNRMSNLKKFAGPLSTHWLQQQEALGIKIVNRMTSLGMIPAVPAFTGHVPDAMKTAYPNVTFTNAGCWLTFSKEYTCNTYLDPTNPLFQKIADAVMEEFAISFGTNSIYSADPFNEMQPLSYDHKYIHDASAAIYNGMKKTDPYALWLLQGWFFLSDREWIKHDNYQVFLNAVEKGHILVLDLYSEKTPIYPITNSFAGQPFVWNMLHNFGGKDGMHGSPGAVREGVKRMLTTNNTCSGVGLTMEGIFQNYAVYQYALDTFWSKTTPVVEEIWVNNYAKQRSGLQSSSQLSQAWDFVWATVYSESRRHLIGETDLSNQGRIVKTFEKSREWQTNPMFSRPNPNNKFSVYYDLPVLCQGWTTMVDLADGLQKRGQLSNSTNEFFLHDLVDITREIMTTIGALTYIPEVNEAFHARDMDALTYTSTALNQLNEDIDSVLKTDKRFMLGPWIAAARSKAGTQQEADSFDEQFRNQITIWGPNGEILDYARKQWSGVMLPYVGARWRLYQRYFAILIATGEPFDAKAFDLVEKRFSTLNMTFPTEPLGDPVKTVRRMRDNYLQACFAAQEN